jgi:hypothetical protein
MANKMQIRRDTAENWTSADPTLSQGELGYELDTGKLKIGDGLRAWGDLNYFDDQSFSGSYDDLTDVPFSDPPNVTDIAGAASVTYVNTAITQLKGGAASALDTLNELATALGNDANFSATVTAQLGLKANSSALSVVATSGAYADLLNKPVLFDGAYNSLTGKPVLFNGDYNNLSNKPVLFTGDYDDLTHKPTLFGGDYDDLTSKPVLFSGDYDDLTSKPTLFGGDYDDLTSKPTLFDGNYNSLTNKPTLFNGQYSSLTGRPTLSTVSGTGEYNDLLNKPSLFSGSYNDLTNKPSLFSGSYNDLTDKPSLFSGSYNDLTDKPSLATVATSGSYNDLTNKPALFNGSYNSLTDKPTLVTSYNDLTDKPTIFDGAYSSLSGKPTDPVYTSVAVGDGTAGNPSIKFSTDGSVDTGIYHPADGVVCISSNGAEKLRVDSGGMRVTGFMKVADVAGNLPNPPEAGMIVLDGTTFKGYNGSAWVNLN